MTDIDIKALRELCAKAKVSAGEFEPGDFPEGTRSQAEYLASAANAVPELLNRVECAESGLALANAELVKRDVELEAAREALRQACNGLDLYFVGSRGLPASLAVGVKDPLSDEYRKQGGVA